MLGDGNFRYPSVRDGETLSTSRGKEKSHRGLRWAPLTFIKRPVHVFSSSQMAVRRSRRIDKCKRNKCESESGNVVKTKSGGDQSNLLPARVILYWELTALLTL